MNEERVKRSIYQAREEQLEQELETATLAFNRSRQSLEKAQQEHHRAHGRVQHLQGQLHALRDLARRDGASIE